MNHFLDYAVIHGCHPIHLHGTHFRVVAEATCPQDEDCSVEYVKMLNEQGRKTIFVSQLSFSNAEVLFFSFTIHSAKNVLGHF